MPLISKSTNYNNDGLPLKGLLFKTYMFIDHLSHYLAQSKMFVCCYYLAYTLCDNYFYLSETCIIFLGKWKLNFKVTVIYVLIMGSRLACDSSGWVQSKESEVWCRGLDWLIIYSLDKLHNLSNFQPLICRNCKNIISLTRSSRLWCV